MGQKAEVPGVVALHKIITDTCRSVHGDDGALDVAIDAIKGEAARCIDGWKPGTKTKFHLVLTVEYPQGRMRNSRAASVDSPPTEQDLTYAATNRCRCGAGLAYDSRLGDPKGSWSCSAVLLGQKEIGDDHDAPKPFIFWKIKGESQPSAGGLTTRPQKEA